MKNGCMTPKLLGGLSTSKYTILNHFWLGQLKLPRLTQWHGLQPLDGKLELWYKSTGCNNFIGIKPHKLVSII